MRMKAGLALLLTIMISAGSINAETAFQIYVKSEIDKQEISVGDVFTLTIEIKKTGIREVSVQSPQLPELDWALKSGFSSMNSFQMLNEQTQSVTTYKVRFKALKTGNYIFPAVSIPYRDPSTNASVEIRTDPVKMSVKKSKGKFSLPGILLIALSGSFLILFLLSRKRKPGEEHKEPEQGRNNALWEPQAEDSVETVLEHFVGEFNDYLKERYQIPENSVKDEIKSVLEKKEFSIDRKEMIFDILDFLYLIKYTGYSPQKDEILRWLEKFRKKA